MADVLEPDIQNPDLRYTNPGNTHHAPEKARCDPSKEQASWVSGCSAALTKRDSVRLIWSGVLKEDEAGTLECWAMPRGIAGTVVSALGRLRMEMANPADFIEGGGEGASRETGFRPLSDIAWFENVLFTS